MKKWIIVIVLLIVIISIGTKAYYDTNVFKVNRVLFTSDKLPENAELTVLQISDLHSKVFGDDNKKLVKTVEESDADIIVITGDLIDRRTNSLKAVFSLIDRLININEHIYFVSGNHEWDNPSKEELLSGLAERNVTLLNNENTQIHVNDITLNVVGVDDVSTEHEDMDKAFDSVGKEGYTILLSHSPNVVEKYTNIPADLILSGHTHGGQVRLPWIGAIIAPDQGLFPKLDKGTFDIGKDQYLYLDSGLGTSMAPIRFLNQSQMSLIKITGRK
ncbi:metallophosphoesterase [Aquibacillus kalidii]|uniref:metallophosphoesterase n=1 Tax=Aquibacillus kalidii TaxID=2762597 RepID=UPI001647F937|nr:metallophosphoesterase [Aquibacillus kalidii]